MRIIPSLVILTAVFSLGLAVGVEAGKNDEVSSDLYLNQEPAVAADRLLDVALDQAEKGSWERIAVGQIHYLRGEKEKALAIFDGIRKKKAADWMRIGRIYYRAGDWELAQQTFDKVLDMAPKDEDWMAEIGAYYNLKGDRKRAEQLFNRSFERDANNLYNTLKAAGSYVGVEER